MQVLISAFTIGPYQGSETGIAWQWITHIAKHCKVFAICGDDCRDDVLRELEILPQKENISFIFNHIPPKVYAMADNQGDWRFYWYYRKWQKKTFEIAQKICAEYKIDIIHHLNMTGYREPGFLWKIKGPKYVWGPVGGMDLCPTNYLKGFDSKVTLKYRIKNLLNWLQFRIEPRIKKAARRSDLLFCDSNDGVRLFQKVYGKECIQINETGCFVPKEVIREKQAGSEEYLDIIWVGRFLPTKLLDLALKTLSLIEDKYIIRLHILGTGELEEKYKKIADDLGVTDRVLWHGLLSRDEVQHIMRNADLFFFTSVVEGTPSVIMECISNGLPILCFDICGFGPLIDESIGMKIQLSSPEQSAMEFAEKMRYLYNNRNKLRRMSDNCASKINTVSWDALSDRLFELYNEIITK